MKELVKFAEQTMSEKEIKEKFLPIEKEIEELETEIIRLKERKKDVEAILAVVDSESESRIVRYRKSLAEENTDVSGPIPEELKKIEAKTFEAKNMIEGLNELLNRKESRLEQLQDDHKEKHVLIQVCKVYSLLDEYNKNAESLGGVLEKIWDEYLKIHSNERRRFKFASAFRKIEGLNELPVLHYDSNKTRIKSETFFWNSSSFFDKRRNRTR